VRLLIAVVDFKFIGNFQFFEKPKDTLRAGLFEPVVVNAGLGDIERTFTNITLLLVDLRLELKPLSREIPRID
jgi:hypothetical protein